MNLPIRKWLAIGDRPDNDATAWLLRKIFGERTFVILKKAPITVPVALGKKPGVMRVFVAMSACGNNRQFGVTFSLS